MDSDDVATALSLLRELAYETQDRATDIVWIMMKNGWLDHASTVLLSSKRFIDSLNEVAGKELC